MPHDYLKEMGKNTHTKKKRDKSSTSAHDAILPFIFLDSRV